MNGFPATLDLIAWNCAVDNSDKQVLHTLAVWHDRFKPDGFTLSEVSTHHDALVEFCEEYPYTLLQETPARNRKRGTVDDTGDCAILVADHAHIQHRWVAAMLRRWIVLRYRRWHDPHRYEVARVKVRGQVWRILAAHPPTHGFEGANREAFTESALMFRRWLSRSLLPSVVVGDLNEQASVLADWFGPKFRVYGERIDNAVTRNVRGCVWSELGRGGSDHHGRRYQFESKG